MALHHRAVKLSPRGMKFLHFPLTRLIISLCCVLLGISLGYFLADLIVRWAGNEPFQYFEELVQMLLVCSSSLVMYWLYVSLIEGRPNSEFSFKHTIELFYGFLIGLLFVSSTMALIALFGGYQIQGWNTIGVMIPFFVMAVQAGIIEEILLRGIGFRIIEDGLGTWWSLGLTALIFGFLHILNDNASVIASLSIALTAGIILALFYVLTRRLWLVIGLHFGWNFILGGFYGAPVSGGSGSGLLQSTLDGPEWITGGAFGPEASVFIVVISLFLTLYLVRKVLKSNQIVKAFYRRSS